jgi:hypothetical protein
MMISGGNRMQRALITLLVLATGVLSQTANAMPWIDPVLRPLFSQEVMSNKPVVVVALFSDEFSPSETVRSQGYTASRVNMMQNSLRSQERAVQMLSSTDSADTQFKQLWVVNGMLIRVRASDIQKVAQLPGVKAIFSNRPIHLIGSRNEGYVSPRQLEDLQYTYGLKNLGIPELRAKHPEMTGKGVRVGILDTGVDANHPDLKGKVVGWKDFSGGNKPQPYDDHGHGTHTSGTIAGGAASGTAIGVAPDVSLIVGKIFSGGGSTTLDAILQAMQWIADPDGDPNTKDAPRLVSNSWGGGGPTPGSDPSEDVLCKAVDAWVKAGMLPVFANGNEGPSKSSVGIPGACPSALGVGATDQNDNITSFSSRGPAMWKAGALIKPDVSAPGLNVVSSVPGGKWASMSGTSMATPHTSGLAALLFQAAPNATPQDVANLLMKSAKDLGPAGKDNDSGAGRIDALKALAPALGERM